MTSENTERLQSGSLAELVFRRIQESIAAKEFLPGTLLPPEKTLCDRYGVGKSSVREAVKMLQVLGVVESRQGIGTWICAPQNYDVMTPMLMNIALQQTTTEELWDFRAMFERAYTHLAVQNAQESDRRMLKRLLEASEKKILAGSMSYDDDLDFHRAVLKCTHNNYVVKIGYVVYELIRPDFETYADYSAKDAVTSHRAIMNAICAGDDAAADKALDTALATFHDILQARKN